MNTQSLNKDFRNDKRNLSEYDHYIAIDWSQVNIALARSTRKNPRPKVVEWEESVALHRKWDFLNFVS